MFDFYSTYIVPISALIPIFIGLRNYLCLPAPFKLLLFFTIAGSLLNLISLIMMAHHYHTVGLFHFYTILEFTFITLIFSYVYDKRWRPYMYFMVAIFDIFCVINYFFIQNKIEFNTYSRPICAFIIVAFCMGYVIKKGADEKKWTDDNFNWINAGLLMYYAVGFIIFIFFNFFLERNIFTDIVWTFHDTILIIEYVLFAIGFSKCRSQITITQPS